MSKGTFLRRAVRVVCVVLAACAVLSPPALGFARSESVQAWAMPGAGAEQAGNPAAMYGLPLDEPYDPYSAEDQGLTLEELQELYFPDLPENEADADAVRFAAYYGLIQGYGDGSFRPDGLLTRAQAVTILRRTARFMGLEADNAGKSDSASRDSVMRLQAGDSSGLHTVSVNGVDLLLDETAEARLRENGNRAETVAFSTAASGAAAEAIPVSLSAAPAPEIKTDAQWAVETGILSDPDGLNRRLDRAQTAEYLYRFAKWAGADLSCSGNLDGWPDGGSVPESSRTALSWGMESGVFRTIVEDALSPSMPVSRGQAARLMTALVSIVPSRTGTCADNDAYNYGTNGAGTDPWAAPAAEDGSPAGETDPWAAPAAEDGSPAGGTDPWAAPAAEDGSPAGGTDPWAAPIAEDRPLADDTQAEQAFYGDGMNADSSTSPAGIWVDQNYSPGAVLAAEIASRTDRGAPESRSRARHAELQSAIEAAAQRYHAVGVQVAVIEDGNLTDVFSTGWAVKNSAEMTPDHRFRVASISKVMVGLAAMCLRDQGVVDLDASIGTYWNASIRNPSYPNTPVNIRSLLTHTSSIYTSEVSLSADAVRSRLTSGRAFGRGKPGSLSNWNYNNYAFGVLGLTLEKAAHKTLDQVLDQSLFGVMGIDASFYGGDVDRRDLVSAVYEGGSVGRSVDKQLSAHAGAPGSSGSYFAGGFTISVRDLGKIAALLANDGVYEGVRLLSAESVELMEYREKVWLDGGFCQAMPLRYRMDAYGRNRLYYHTGSAYGAFNGFSYDPDARDGVVVLTSGASGARDRNGNYAVCGAVFDAVYRAIAR